MEAELVKYMGDDLDVVNSARVSFDKRSDWEEVDSRSLDAYGNMITYKTLSNKDTKLINYLAKHGHFTPFTHCVITLRETVPIFVARQRFKHMVGFSYNEVSRRYDDSEPEFYYPDKWRKRAENIKQGSSDETITEIMTQQGVMPISDAYSKVVNWLGECYKHMIEAGVAPEQARMVLPQSMYTSYYTTGSLYAFARAYNLRIDGHAQLEIQELAKQWDKIIRPLYPVSWAALTTK